MRTKSFLPTNHGIGTSPNVMSTPSEQIGFLATEEYATRLASPRPQSAGYHKNQSQTHVDSPLRKESIPGDIGKLDLSSALSQSIRSEHPHESEVEDDDVVHIDPPERRASVVYGSGGYMESTESLGHAGTPGGEENITDEHGYSAPILAADEVAKDPFGYELQPAVSPNQERSSTELAALYRTASASSSRPSSRPVSIHGGVAGIRFHPVELDRESHYTPLEDLEEYEPLFPEDEKSGASRLQEKPLTVADKLKRPDMKNRKFPSQDIWEDTPNSLHYTTTVSTPQLPEETEESKRMKSLQIHEDETPEQAFARRQEELAEKEAADADSFLNREKKPWAHNPDIDTRLSAKQRFPSRDIWESSPDSLQLTTTVSQPQADEKEMTNLPEDRPTTGAVAYHQEKAAAGLELGHEEGRATTGMAATLKPQVPARPTKQKPAAVSSTSATSSPTDKTAPPIPAKSKPQVPARPAKSTSKDVDTAPLTKVISASSSKSVESDQGSQSTMPPKAKPPVPTRPMGSKIAALQGGFMSDLNKRLQLGPQASKKEEPAAEEVIEEKEKAPLADARKGRARGPARRAPAKSPAPATELASVPATTSTLGFSKPATLWHIHPDHGSLSVNSYEDMSASHAAGKTIEAQAPTLATNTAGQSLKEPEEATHVSEKPAAGSTVDTAASQEPSVEDIHAKEAEEQRKQIITIADNQSASPSKLTDDPPVASIHDIETEDLSESTATLKGAPESKKEQDTTDSAKEREQTSTAEEHASTATEVKEKLETLVGVKEVLTGTGGGDHSTSTGMEKEQMPGSFERDSKDTEK
jgi:Altered inheritance of mitochondria protein 21